MKLVVGLGNPGTKFKNTRHNVGFLVVDSLPKRRKFLTLKPDKFMNRSGLVLKSFLKKNPKIDLKNVYVVHDDLDIELGKYKISFTKGPKVHNGLANIYEQLGTKDFWHVRIGIDNRQTTGFKGMGEEYVLSTFRSEEREMITKVIDKVVKELAHA
jgi:PTH1 family peptidyl-tRNA hydrolase